VSNEGCPWLRHLIREMLGWKGKGPGLADFVKGDIGRRKVGGEEDSGRRTETFRSKMNY